MKSGVEGGGLGHHRRKLIMRLRGNCLNDNPVDQERGMRG